MDTGVTLLAAPVVDEENNLFASISAKKSSQAFRQSELNNQDPHSLAPSPLPPIISYQLPLETKVTLVHPHFQPAATPRHLLTPYLVSSGSQAQCWRCLECGHLAICPTGSTTLLAHWKQCHPRLNFTSMCYSDISSGRPLSLQDIFPRSLWCTHPGCSQVFPSTSLEEARRGLQEHWENVHSDSVPMSKTYREQFHFVSQQSGPDFTRNLTVTNSPNSPTAIKPSITSEELPFEATQSAGIQSHVRHAFHCSFPDCHHSCSTPQLFGKHWNSKHPEDPSKASFINVATNNSVSLFDAFKFVVQCSICQEVRCASYHGRQPMEQHLQWKHAKEIQGASSLADFYRVLQDNCRHSFKKEGTALIQESPIEVEQEPKSKIKKRVSHKKQNKALCKIEGCMYKEACTVGWQKRMLHHFLSIHDLLIDSLLVQELPSGRQLRVQDLFKYLGQCLQEDCLLIDGVVEGDVEDLDAVFNKHCNADHSGVPTDFNVVVEDHGAKFDTERK